MIVALDAASTDPSLALANPDGSPLASDGWEGEARQASELLPRLLALLERSGRSVAETSAVAVGVGPGSFTGLRVAMSLAKGLSLALSVPLVGIPSLEAWLVADPEALAAASRAGAQDAYLLVRGESEPRIVDSAALASLAGGRAIVMPRELASAFGLAGGRSPTRAASAIAGMAAARLAADPRGDDLDLLQPAYLRPPRGLAAAPPEPAPWR